MKRVAVILSGCGFKDGSEITEAISSLVAITEFGATYEIFAPDIRVQTTDHLNGSSQGERNALHEAARIARGKIKDVKSLDPKKFDALFFPGGYGAALYLCNWVKVGSQCEVLPSVKGTVEAFYKESKPIGAVCIAPVILAKVLGSRGITVTIGDDKETAAEIAKTGAQHENCSVTDYVTDREHKIVTSPAYMYGDAKPCDVFTGVRGAVKELVEMA